MSDTPDPELSYVMSNGAPVPSAQCNEVVQLQVKHRLRPQLALMQELALTPTIC